MTDLNEQDIVYRLNKRAEIRRQISSRKSVQEGKPDRIADLLEEAAQEIDTLRIQVKSYGQTIASLSKSEPKEKVVYSEEQIATAYEKITGGWKDLEPELWEEVIISCHTAGEEVDSGYGTHCSNSVYRIGQHLYDLTYEYGHMKPIDIKFKRVSE